MPRSLRELVDPRVAGGFEFGLGPVVGDANSFVRGGRALGDVTEAVGRLATYTGLRRQGFARHVAAAASKAAHVDFQRLTQFERNAARIVMPFYSFSRHQITYQLGNLLQAPGGGVAQTIRGFNQLRDDSGFIPQQLEGGLAIPLGSEDAEGRQQFIAGLELPIESVVRPFGGSLQQTGLGLLVPGQSTYQGTIGSDYWAKLLPKW